MTCHTTGDTVNIPQHNYVVGEQGFMPSPSAPVIEAGKQNLLHVFQAIFAEIKRGKNRQRAKDSTFLL